MHVCTVLLHISHTQISSTNRTLCDPSSTQADSYSQQGRSWVLYESLAYSILVVASLLWLLRVVAHITLTPHVVVAFAAFLRRFAEDPPTIVDFLVPKC